MPNTREKLIDLIQTAKSKKQYDFLFGNIDDAIDMKSDNEYIADHLIANGVRLEEKQATSDKSKWISVKERLPERYKYVLLWDAMDRDIFMGILNDKREWYCPGYQDEPFDITHWMPLPEKPKGE